MDDDDLPIWSIDRPHELSHESWEAISIALDRLRVALSREDIPAVIGSAKELCETVARVVLAQRGPNVGSKASYDELITAAHRAIERQPGEGLAKDEDVRRIAQGAKQIVCSLGPMRNQRGTGHGRAHPPDVEAEHAQIAVDAAVLWCRWVLRRLGHYMLGDISVLVRRLQEGGIFRSGDLTARLEAVDLQHCSDQDASLVGAAVAQRAIRETFNVRIEGVYAPLKDPDAWPRSFRQGVVEGLLFSPDGTLTTTAWGIDQAAQLVALHPSPDALIDTLVELADAAVWSAPSVGNPPTFAEVTQT